MRELLLLDAMGIAIIIVERLGTTYMYHASRQRLYVAGDVTLPELVTIAQRVSTEALESIPTHSTVEATTPCHLGPPCAVPGPNCLRAVP